MTTATTDPLEARPSGAPGPGVLLEHADLYQRLLAFRIDDDDDPGFSFAARLARDNGWSAAYAGRVIVEYKRFVLLGRVAGHPVTPSDQVDQAWHLHLVYSRSYWERMCGAVLGQPFHHGPTTGEEEQPKFNSWYERTGLSYRRVFGEPPPPDIWPEARYRFGDDLHFVRVNTRRNVIVSRRRLVSAALWWIAIAMLVLGALALWRPSAITAGSPARTSTPSVFLVPMTLATGVTPAPAPSRRQPGSPGSFGSGPRGRSTTPSPPPSGKTGRGDVWVGAVVVTVLIIIVVIAAVRGQVCAQCRRRHAMKKTGGERTEGRFLKRTDLEWRCKYCGYTEWKKKPSGASGGEGCGGCGGCGG